MLYYQAKWLVDSEVIVNGKVRKFIDNCSVNGCHLKAEGYETSDGFIGMLFVLQVPDDFELKALETIGNSLGIVRWDLGDESAYTSIPSFSFQDKYPDGTLRQRGTIMESWYQIGRHNSRLREQLSNDV